MGFFFILSGIIMILPGIYLYMIVQRFLGLFPGENKIRRKKIIAAFTALLLVLCSVNLFGTGALLVLHFTAASTVIDIIRLLIKKAGRSIPNVWDKIYRSSALPLLITAAIMGYAYLNMHRIIVTEYEVPVQKEIRREGYRIVFLSDLHFGTTMNQEKLQEQCRRMEAEKPDLVVLGGDIVDEASSLEEVTQAFQTLGQIQSTYGIYYVYGNHDKGKYNKNCDFTAENLSEAARDAGVYILEDETVMLNEELSVSGRRDRSDAVLEQIPRKSCETLLEGMPQTAVHVIADHQPRDMEENAAAGFDLMLSGHTHAGQMWPVGLITELFDKGTVNYGMKTFGNMHLIVSSGIAGWGYPLRTGKHSEFAVISVTAARD